MEIHSFYKDWFEKGIKYVDQLYDFEVNCFYSFEDFQFFYSMTKKDFLRYYSLFKIIPKEIKNRLNQHVAQGQEGKTLLNKVK